MILLKVKGGLGNQMFQYAFGRAEASRLGTGLILDISWYRKADRSFLIDKFGIADHKVISSRPFSYLAKKILPSGAIYDGFWEDQRYASSIRGQLLKEFVLRNPSKKFSDMRAGISEDAISIHVRRGDYLTVPDKLVLEYPYYEKAVKLIMEQNRLTDPRIIIFSDDKEWCRNNMASICGIKTEIFDDPQVTSEEELVLMSCCRHNIIANSTFSWWAAFLNQNKVPTIIAPQSWYKDADRNTSVLSALILPEWTVIQ
jgi:hypothetical protein